MIIQIMVATALVCVARDIKSRILESLLATQRKAQKEGRGVDLHLHAGDGQIVSIHQVQMLHLSKQCGGSSIKRPPQVMVMSRSLLLRSLANTQQGQLTLLIPDSIPSTLHLLVPLLYGSSISVPAQSYAALSSLCTSLGLHDWLHREVERMEQSAGNYEVGERNKQRQDVSHSKETSLNSDKLKCEICGKKYQSTISLHKHYNSVHFNDCDPSPVAPLITQRTRNMQKMEEEKATKEIYQSKCVAPSMPSPTSERSRIKTLSPIKVLHSETSMKVGSSGDERQRSQGSIFLPWRFEDVDQGTGREVFRWQYNFFNRKLRQHEKVSEKQKEFCCLWNDFLWIEVHICLSYKSHKLEVNYVKR